MKDESVYLLKIENIHKFLYDLDMSYYYVATHLNISEYEFKCYLNHEKNTPLSMVLEMCKLFNTQIEQITEQKTIKKEEQITNEITENNSEFGNLDEIDFEN